MSAPEPSGDAVVLIEQAMVALRRSQARRTLHRRTAGDDAPGEQAAAFQVLDAVEAATAAGDELTVTGVAGALGVDQPRASRLVAQTVERGLVRRAADPRDGRRSVLTLTPRGRRVLTEAHRTRRDAVAEALSGWPRHDRETFARLLDAFARAWVAPSVGSAPGTRHAARGR